MSFLIVSTRADKYQNSSWKFQKFTFATTIVKDCQVDNFVENSSSCLCDWHFKIFWQLLRRYSQLSHTSVKFPTWISNLFLKIFKEILMHLISLLFFGTHFFIFVKHAKSKDIRICQDSSALSEISTNFQREIKVGEYFQVENTSKSW